MNPHETGAATPPELGEDRVAAMLVAIDARLDADDRERSRRRRTALLAAAAAVVVGTSTGLVVDVLPSTSAGDDATSMGAAYSEQVLPPTTPAELESLAAAQAEPNSSYFPDDWAVPLSEVRASGNAYLDVPDAEATADDLESWMPSADGRVELASVAQDGDDTTATLRLRFPAGELSTLRDHLASLDDDASVEVTRTHAKTDGGAKEESLTPTAGRLSDAVLYVVLSTAREPEQPQQAALERGSDAVAAALPWMGGALVGAAGVLWARRPRTRRS